MMLIAWDDQRFNAESTALHFGLVWELSSSQRSQREIEKPSWLETSERTSKKCSKRRKSMCWEGFEVYHHLLCLSQSGLFSKFEYCAKVNFAKPNKCNHLNRTWSLSWKKTKNLAFIFDFILYVSWIMGEVNKSLDALKWKCLRNFIAYEKDSVLRVINIWW